MDDSSTHDAPTDRPTHPTLYESFRVWCRVALLSFGGPAGQIAVMHRILVDEKRWISEDRFLHALNYCMLLPGPEAQQLATYTGWLLHGTFGGLMAGTLFVLPGFLSILALSVVYVEYHDLLLIQGLFFGLKPAVVAVVIEAVIRIGRRALKNRVMVAIAAAAFVAIFLLRIPFPLIILAAGLLGYFGGRLWPDKFIVIKGHAVPAHSSTSSALISDGASHTAPPTLRKTLSVMTLWLAIWLVPIALLIAFTGWQSIFAREAIFFSQVAMVTFGGAYSVLSYIAQECVNTHGWLTAGEMQDGLGMAETTPGPLIQVVQFVGFLGAYRQPSGLPPLVAGLAGSIVTTWVTYAPCFLWIFTGAPYIEHLRGRQLLSAALSAITAAVVGVILNLSIWFSLHTLFGSLTDQQWGPIHWLAPDWRTLNLAAAAITAGAMWGLFRRKLGLLVTLAICAAAGVLWTLATAR